ncbi:MAG: NRAMP family divalent metal transporter [Aminobacterium sp.]|jgi:Mn2+/Fe2+ NRAMP family transporter|uniref:NRAMP family divalent metal transporter n=1 Tax=unclassified Aminobacterium TaxID=2685012 RepID=UPI001BD051D9|nr:MULTISPECIES: NRAMP family divalent metal transporter [unclassified Aminobacterium]MDD2207701.1 divalent metal cation transporter [Aminobacterium sp.]MDD3708304.1 divalent metal cation transporter [Aminobacterium sp.]MDD4229731.1 divalent metal cation transporter [Aminobacterium sp.]MDD4552527.1 divalent metal cation transporter [Aminobacterium sp.]MEA4877669.1 NRAMP family divalent metal transporter [Aminobacterium sp.]
MNGTTKEMGEKKALDKKGTLSVLLGAAFLMATSAIGPGFLTQSAVFTQNLKAAFSFGIILSLILSFIVQINIWRILAVSGMRAQDVANKVLPGLGYFLAFAVALGGLVFNIGNIAGAAMGLNVVAGVPLKIGAVVSAAIAVLLFLRKELGKAMDTFTKILGFMMIALVLYMVFNTKPPVALAVKEAILPSKIDWMIILTLIGGTVGGYITFAGAHRIIDAGIVGQENLGAITRGASNAIGITGIMRILLFLAVLGVVATGQTLDPANPPASAFRLGAGELGYKVFGVVIWAAGITSVIGASYTSISFLKTLFSTVETHLRWWMIGFIVVSTTIFSTIGQPVTLLIFAGSINGLILPLSLVSVLLAAYKKEVVGSYHHPIWMTVLGYVVAAFTLWMGIKSFTKIFTLFS